MTKKDLREWLIGALTRLRKELEETTDKEMRRYLQGQFQMGVDVLNKLL